MPLKSIYTVGESTTQSGFAVYYLFEYKDGNIDRKADAVYMVYKTTVLGEWISDNIDKLSKSVFELEIDKKDNDYGTNKTILPVKARKVKNKPKPSVQVQMENF